ncbi:MAG: translation elongation factor Ts [Candidatus Anaerobiospirillum merdipullorum]|uniref:Elongation factor Ts n=1 Tax=Candidatus Anaerobiospirillum merdipullorum TaxID=2838450 RepID=A0A9E2KNZ6_9GAMM|nr:translation elongation factor Ts [Candidatus Anaerobiospirillum merdipullorum]
MANVTAAMVKELRDRTGAGMMDCKKALVAADGNMEVAIEEMRKSGAVKAAKKAGRTAAEGVIAVAREGNKAVLVEVNSETDFAAKNAEFTAFAQKAADVALANGCTDAESLKAQTVDGQTLADALTALTAKIGEHLELRRVAFVEGDNLGVYLHSNHRIGVIASLKGGNEEVAKDVAMHVCAAKPDFVHPEDVSAEVVERERQIQIEIAMNSGKPKEIAEKMVAGRMKKFTGEVALTGQAFIRDPNITVGQMLKEHGNADVISFVRLEVGEGIEKKVDNFADEVQAQIAAASK